MSAQVRHRQRFHRPGTGVFLLVCLVASITAAADCSLGAGSVFYRHENAQSNRAAVASFGCELQRFDVCARYFSRQEVTRERPRGPTKYVTDAHVTLSVMRVWNMHPRRRFSPMPGAGLFVKSSDSPRMCELVNQPVSGPYTVCRGDPWVPLPVEFSLMASLAGERWSFSLTHVSNAYLNTYNWGQNFMEVGYHW